MVTRKELIELLADLAAPLTPFTLAGAPQDDALFMDWLERRSQEQLRPILDDAVDAFIGIVSHPPAHHEYMPPARDESSFKAELLGLAELYGQTPHALRILRGVEPALRRSSCRVWVIEALGRLRLPATLPHLRKLATSPLTLEESLSLVSAVGETGGEEARSLLMELRARHSEVEVQREIEITLAQLSTC